MYFVVKLIKRMHSTALWWSTDRQTRSFTEIKSCLVRLQHRVELCSSISMQSGSSSLAGMCDHQCHHHWLWGVRSLWSWRPEEGKAVIGQKRWVKYDPEVGLQQSKGDRSKRDIVSNCMVLYVSLILVIYDQDHFKNFIMMWPKQWSYLWLSKL